MAKGRQKHQDYLDALSLLGKDLARRAHSKCELSGVPGSLDMFDLEDSSVEPDLDHVVLVCEDVRQLLEANKVTRPRDTLRGDPDPREDRRAMGQRGDRERSQYGRLLTHPTPYHEVSP